MHSVTIQHNFCTFVAVLHIFISQNLSPTNRDGLSHAWLFKPSRVNVINVHDYNAELQLSVLISEAASFVWDSIVCQAWDPPAGEVEAFIQTVVLISSVFKHIF